MSTASMQCATDQLALAVQSGSISGQILQQVHDAVITTDATGIILQANSGTERVFGYAIDELLGRPIELLIPARYVQHHSKLIDQFVASGEHNRPMTTRREVAARRRDGSEFPASASISRIETEMGLALTVVLRDDTERHTATNQLNTMARAIDSTASAVMFIDPSGIITYANSAALELSSASNEAVLGRHYGALFSSSPALERMAEAVDHGRYWSGEIDWVSQGGPSRRLEGQIAPTHDAGGTATGAIATLTDVTQHHQSLLRVHEYHERLEQLQEIAHLGSWDWDIATGNLAWSTEVYRIFGLDEQTFGASYEAFLRAIHPDDRDMVTRSVESALRGVPYNIEHRVLRPDGSIRHVRERGEVIDDAGQPVRMIGIVHDITDLRNQVTELEERERFIRSVLDATDAETAVIDKRGIVIAANRSWIEASRRRPQSVGGPYIDAGLAELGVAPDAVAGTIDGIRRVLQGDARRFAHDYSIPSRDTRPEAWKMITVEPLLTGDGGAVISHRDITARKTAEHSLEFQALHDHLTGLPNRMWITKCLAAALRTTDQSNSGVALMLIDLDRFKVINDSLGHEVGDRLLHLVSDRLAHAIRSRDVVGRLGGDEFVIVCFDVDTQVAAATLADRVKTAFTAPFAIEGRRLFVAPSIGIAIAAPGEATSQTLMRDADTAMYRAKAAGGNQFCLFDDALRLQVNESLELEHDLRFAIERQEFKLYYQAQHEVATGRAVGAEALLRWQHPTRGFVSPATFIPIAEETGLINEIGLWVFNEAARQIRRWLDNGLLTSNEKISVNLSARELCDPALLPRLLTILDREQINGHNIGVEITETAVMEDPDSALRVFTSLRNAGVTIAIDDFGTGHASLVYLSDFPVDILKIDRVFVSRLGDDDRANAIVRNLVALANDLGLTVIAEGIETPTQAALLTNVGCGIAQGFLYSRPMPGAELERLWRRPLPWTRSDGLS